MIMKLKYKRILKKKGVTLVELIVVMAITTIIFAIAIGMLTPVTNLMNSIKGNAHMDTICDTVNEYIRSSLDKAVDVSILVYPDSTADYWGGSDDDKNYIDETDAKIKAAWKKFSEEYKEDDGYVLKALGIMQNYNNDFRLFDFGEVSTIDMSWWGGEAGTQPIVLKSEKDTDESVGQTFLSLLDFRDGGGRNRTWEDPVRSGVNGNEFGKFSPFNDAFYSNGVFDNENYSLQVAFESVAGNLEDGSAGGVNYLTISTQMFKRNGDKYTDGVENLTYEPANQVKSISFKMLNGNAKMDTVSGGKINKVELVNGAKQIVSEGKYGSKTFNDNVVILYAVKTF